MKIRNKADDSATLYLTEKETSLVFRAIAEYVHHDLRPADEDVLQNLLATWRASWRRG